MEEAGLVFLLKKKNEEGVKRRPVRAKLQHDTKFYADKKHLIIKHFILLFCVTL